MKRMIILFLLLAGWCAGADYSVYIDSDDGSDGTWAAMQVEGTPCQTIDAALVASRANLSAGDTLYLNLDGSATAAYDNLNMSNAAYLGRNYVVQKWDGRAGDPVINEGDTYIFFTNTTGEPASITFDDIDLTCVKTSGFGFDVTAGDPNVTFTNCEIVCDSGAGWMIMGSTGVAKSIIYSGCTVSCSQSDLMRIHGADTLALSNSTFTVGDGAGDWFLSWGGGDRTVNEVTIDGCVITSHTADAISTAGDGNLTSCKYLKITDSTITTTNGGSGIVLGQSIGKTLVSGCKINAYAAGFLVGSDVTPYSISISNVICIGNSIISQGNGHCLALLDGANYGYYASNYVYGGNWVLPLKGIGNVIKNNVIVGPYGIQLNDTYDDEDCYANQIIGNVIYATSGNGAVIMHLTGTGGTDGRVRDNIIIDNIIHGGEASYAVTDDASDIHGNNYFDYNCYYTGTSGLFLLNSNTPSTSDTITELKAAWDGWTDDGEFDMAYANDRNSIVANPQLDSNYKAGATVLKNAGTPLLIKSDGTVLLRNDIGPTKHTTARSGLFRGELLSN